MEAGSVQGVVVQIMVETFLPARAGSIFAGSLVSRYFTQTLGLVRLAYSISASARAVLSWMHQYTGRRPLYTAPFSMKLNNCRTITDSYCELIVEYGCSQRPRMPSRLNCSRWMLRYFSAYSRHFLRTAMGGISSFLRPSASSTLISIGRPWQSQPGT